MNKAETWTDIEGYEGIYQVSDMGRVRRIRRRHDSRKKDKSICRLLKPKRAGRDYWTVCLSKQHVETYYYIHRLVAEAFLPNLDRLPQVNHKNCDKSDNRVVNLEWISVAENHSHAVAMGMVPRGELSPSAKLTAQYVILAREFVQKGYATRQELAEMMGVAYGTMSDAIAGRTWTWLSL